MERLTSYKNETSREMICRCEDCDVCEEYCSHTNEDNCYCLQDILEKLGQYEDLEEQGLLFKLPFKIGDTVWTPLSMSGWYLRKSDAPYKAKVVFIGLNDSKEMGYGLFNVVYENRDYMMEFNFSDIGKTVFISKEEAEESLAETEQLKSDKEVGCD